MHGRAHSDRATVVCRTHRCGYHAGNLNHAPTHHVHEAFVAVSDADELLPAEFVHLMLGYFTSPHLAFVQARHVAHLDSGGGFARMLALSVDLFYSRSLTLRNRFSFVSCSGHGMMIRRSTGCRRLVRWGPQTPVVPFAIGPVSRPRRHLVFALAAATAYVSLMPTTVRAALVVLTGLHPAFFVVTGVMARRRRSLRHGMVTSTRAGTVLGAAACLPSPACGPAAALGLILLVGPLLGYADCRDLRGSLAKFLPATPYVALVVLTARWV